MSSITKRFASLLPPSRCYILHPCGFRTRLSHVVEVVNLQLFIRHNEMTWIEKSFLLRKNWSGLLWSHNLHPSYVLGVKKNSIVHKWVPSFYAFDELFIIAASYSFTHLTHSQLSRSKKRWGSTSSCANGLMCVNWDRKKKEQFTLKNIIAS